MHICIHRYKIEEEMLIHKHSSSTGQKAQSCEYKNSAMREEKKNLSIEKNN
jgi:hypothetical protein